MMMLMIELQKPHIVVINKHCPDGVLFCSQGVSLIHLNRIEFPLYWFASLLQSNNICCHYGATENAGVENAGVEKMQEWKSREWKSRHQSAGVEIAGVEIATPNCRVEIAGVEIVA